jgi:hypothetical protein
MAKMSKAVKKAILEQKFPEFFRLSQELGEACDAIIMELQEKLDKIEEVQDMKQELEDAKEDLDL